MDLLCFKAGIVHIKWQPENLLRGSSLPVKKKRLFPLFSPLLLLAFCQNNKLNASDVCGCGLINLCSKLLLHTQHHCLLTCRCSEVGPLQRSAVVGPAVVTGPGLIVCSLQAEVIGRCHCLNRPSSGKTNQGLLIAMAFSSFQIKHLHTSQERQHPLRPLVKYCKYSAELRAGQAHHHHHHQQHHSQDVTHSPSLAMGVFSTQPHWPPPFPYLNAITWFYQSFMRLVGRRGDRSSDGGCKWGCDGGVSWGWIVREGNWSSWQEINTVLRVAGVKLLGLTGGRVA